MEFKHQQHFREGGGSSDATTTCHTYVAEKGTLFAGRSDGKIAWWRRRSVTGRAQAEDKPFFLEGHGGAVRCIIPLRLSGSRDGIMLLSGSSDRTIRLWDPWVRDLKTACVQTLRGHDGTVTSLAVHNRLLFSCSTDRTLRLWQMDEGRDMLLYPWYTLQETVQGHDCWLNALALHVIGESGEVFAADERGCVCAFQLAIRGRLVSLSRWQQHPSVHGLSIVAMLLVPGENLLFTISFDQTMRALNVSSGVPVLTVANPRKVRFTGMHWHEGTRQLFLVDELGYLLAWSIGAERCTKDEQLLAAVRTAPSSAPGFVSVSAHADELFAADQAGCHCWHILRDLGYTEVGGHTGPVIALVSSEGSRESDGLFYSASVDNTIRGWEPGAMACVSTLHEVHSEIASLLYSAANGFLISGHDDGSIRLWNSESGSTINLVEHTNTVCCLELGVRGRTELLLSAGFDGCVALWDITKRKHAMPHIETIFRAHEPYEILALRFNPLNGTIISAGNDRQIRVWSVATYELLGALDGHTDSVTALALDGNFLLSGSEDCTVRVWDTHANTLLQTIVAHDEPVEQLLVVPETGFLVTCSSRCIRVWHYGEEHLLTEWRHPDAIRSLGLLRKQRKIACGTEQCRIVLFSLDEPIAAEAERTRLLAEQAFTTTTVASDDERAAPPDDSGEDSPAHLSGVDAAANTHGLSGQKQPTAAGRQAAAPSALLVGGREGIR